MLTTNSLSVPPCSRLSPLLLTKSPAILNCHLGVCAPEPVRWTIGAVRDSSQKTIHFTDLACLQSCFLQTSNGLPHQMYYEALTDLQAFTWLDAQSYVTLYFPFVATSPALLQANDAAGASYVGTGSTLYNNDGSPSAVGNLMY